ncbi:KR-domain-containing protein [Bimuria novae-zelandiae CBS 107.79]|uniref:KR-domain-containing protein n=1 Tax=Bimuria novae-zelandiae CBS 107.79 TaxID=1447943 RepID=A0A6A5UQX2_9PLEO|nr:KR-domain-containing protein [Bimuria novae-zelandiae CBS 107.79]
MEQCSQQLQPIKRVVKMAMVLRDTLFGKNGLRGLTSSAKTKVQGTWNLHKYFSHQRPLDFIIFCFSISGVTENPGQAHYDAGNMYQDELKHYRRTQGLEAVSVNLGIMLDVAENDAALHKFHSIADSSASPNNYKRLSHLLHNALPSRDDTERICRARRYPSVLASEILTLPYNNLNQNGLKTAESLLQILEPESHPVLLARHMLQLAIFLQHLHPVLHHEIQANLDLQCVMMESMYEANVDNLRRSWVAGKRAMGSSDRSMAPEALLASDTPMGRLERLHCVIASQILERNESKLQRAAHSLPSKWWLAPTLDATSADSQDSFWDTRRLFAQVLHYNLLNQLHLPFMLRSSLTDLKSEYSRITCVNASREVLTRFITLRSFNQIAYSCRTIDFLALMAAMTLLLAHLNSDSEAENLLGHQYVSDRALIERAQENMKEVNRLNSDALSAECGSLLQRLLSIEPEAGDAADIVNVQEAETEQVMRDEDAVVSIHIPYFGIIKTARGGMSKEVPCRPPIAPASDPHPVEASRLQDRGTVRPLDSGYVPSLSSTISSSPAELDFSGLTACGNDWALQEVDIAFFDSLISNASNEATVGQG